MLRIFPIVFFVALSGCTQKGGNGDALSQHYTSQISDLNALVTAHVKAVSEATDLSTVDDLEAQHQADMTDAMGEMTMTMDTMMSCGMNGMMGDVQPHMDDMMKRMSDHVTTQEGTEDLSTCAPEESIYQTDMMDHMDAMSGMMSGGMMGSGCDTNSGMGM